MDPSAVSERVLIHEIYCPASLSRALDDYRPHLDVRVQRTDEHETVIAFTSPNGEVADEEVVHEFLNYVLDLSVRSILGAA
jgi:hypothetical protein